MAFAKAFNAALTVKENIYDIILMVILITVLIDGLCLFGDLTNVLLIMNYMLFILLKLTIQFLVNSGTLLFHMKIIQNLY